MPQCTAMVRAAYSFMTLGIPGTYQCKSEGTILVTQDSDGETMELCEECKGAFAERNPEGYSYGSVPMRDWMVWSYEHRAWWKPGDMGYTTDFEEAARYTQAQAVKRSQTVDTEGMPQEVAVGPELIAALRSEVDGA